MGRIEDLQKAAFVEGQLEESKRLRLAEVRKLMARENDYMQTLRPDEQKIRDWSKESDLLFFEIRKHKELKERAELEIQHLLKGAPAGGPADGQDLVIDKDRGGRGD